MSRRYVTTAIPYVNSKPHLGFAMELVQTDVMARHWRHRGDEVRFLTGTDDNSLKNAIAAEAEGVPTKDFVDRNAAAFEKLREPLQISFDDFIRTSADPRHRAGVDRLWRAADAQGDLYRKDFQGLYCVGCEQFYAEAELVDGTCPEHFTPPVPVSEENWFFKLSRYEDQLRELIEPESRRNEVPGDPSQVVYVWWDALGNYLTALDYGTDGENYRHWWAESDQRTHVIGKGIIRFHAVYWPAMLLSAGLPLPTTIFVHHYLTVEGRKLGQPDGQHDPQVPRRHRPPLRSLPGRPLTAAIAAAPKAVDEALARFDLHTATEAVWKIVEEANRYVVEAEPWTLAKAEKAGEAEAGQRLSDTLALLIHAARVVADELTPFLPGAAARVAAQLGGGGDRLGAPPLFPRIETAGG